MQWEARKGCTVVEPDLEERVVRSLSAVTGNRAAGYLGSLLLCVSVHAVSGQPPSHVTHVPSTLDSTGRRHAEQSDGLNHGCRVARQRLTDTLTDVLTDFKESMHDSLLSDLGMAGFRQRGCGQ
jgi:hypothetical protein